MNILEEEKQSIIELLSAYNYDNGFYKYCPEIKSEEDIRNNFREQFIDINAFELYKLNFTDNEFERLLEDMKCADVFEYRKKFSNGGSFIKEDCSKFNYILFNDTFRARNRFQLIHKPNTKNALLLLVNGLPFVQINLLESAVSKVNITKKILKENQKEVEKKSLLSFVQIFVVHHINTDDIWYFINNNKEHFDFNTGEAYLPICKFFDENNNKISTSDTFYKAFLNLDRLFEIIKNYTLFNEEKKHIVCMRAHQIHAIESFFASIYSNSSKEKENAYFWHTTGSGKTLTILLIALKLLEEYEGRKKCIFVVDRKDLEAQSISEFNSYVPSCVKENKDTKSLIKLLLSSGNEEKIIITTIQKLAIAVQKKENNELDKVKEEDFIFIFDECHRSQFGKSHKAIKKYFSNAQLVGFTGTPIFENNAIRGLDDFEQYSKQKTKSIFKNLLHSYTLKNAIDDNFVLPFKIDYFKIDEKVAKDKKEIVAEFILNNHKKYTYNKEFNAIFATSSIKDAIEYYTIFKNLQEKSKNPLNISCIFSPPTKTKEEYILDEEQEYTSANNKEIEKKKKALEEIIKDYNSLYRTTFTIKDFNNYYEDVQKRIKMQESPTEIFPQRKKIDVVIVVDMLLTGFDSKYINTFYVDRNLKWHGLVQAFSRTNRLMKGKKEYGNIIDFYNEKEKVDEAIALFSHDAFVDAQKYIILPEENKALLTRYVTLTHAVLKFIKINNLTIQNLSCKDLHTDEMKQKYIEVFKHLYKFIELEEEFSELDTREKEKKEEILSTKDYNLLKKIYFELLHITTKAHNAKGKKISTVSIKLNNKTTCTHSVIIDYEYISQIKKQFKYIKDTSKIILAQKEIYNILEPVGELERYLNILHLFIAKFVHNNIGIVKSRGEIEAEYISFKDKYFWRYIKKLSQKYGLSFEEVEYFIAKTRSKGVLDFDRLEAVFANYTKEDKEEKMDNFLIELRPFINNLGEQRPSKDWSILYLDDYEEAIEEYRREKEEKMY